ncbi:MFS transporter [Williamsia phyllosphaerae]|uniref:MFS transporter n=1 Tax=Williamsia phyllosphaerae TaxID=885042 RepID=A0ABQ1UAM1_9NOCA|nr:MFS transporter [Williamsia phyllosphaerae]GGF14569.1 MFS transporter [Williamsia phyllosphaerae]
MFARRSPWWGLVALCLPMLLVSMDVSVLFFAVPYISADLDPTPAQQLWIFDVYGFVLAGLLLTMGAVADRIGHRRLLLIGAVGFSAASILAAYADSATTLIAARALLGVAGATLMPSTLALIRHLFDDPRQRTTAIATWTAVMSGGVAVGPIISGFLLDHFWWGSVFLINVPVMIALLFVGPFLLPAGTGDPTRKIDLPSSVLALATLLPVVGGIKAMATDGWSLTNGGIVVAGVVAGIAFAIRQLRLDHPLIDLRLFSDRRFSTSIWINLIAMFGVIGNAILMTQYLQSVLGYSPLIAALWSLAPTVAVGFAAPASTALAARFGRPAVISGGLSVAASGFVVLATTTGTSSLLAVLIGAGLLAAGLVATTALVADHIVGVAPADRAGSVAGLLETTSELGGALGIAILGSVLNMFYRSGFDSSAPGVDTSARESLGGAVATAGRVGGEAGAQILRAGREAFVGGLHGSAIAGAILLAATAVAAGLLLRRDEPSADHPAQTRTPKTTTLRS